MFTLLALLTLSPVQAADEPYIFAICEPVYGGERYEFISPDNNPFSGDVSVRITRPGEQETVSGRNRFSWTSHRVFFTAGENYVAEFSNYVSPDIGKLSIVKPDKKSKQIYCELIRRPL